MTCVLEFELHLRLFPLLLSSWMWKADLNLHCGEKEALSLDFGRAESRWKHYFSFCRFKGPGSAPAHLLILSFCDIRSNELVMSSSSSIQMSIFLFPVFKLPVACMLVRILCKWIFYQVFFLLMCKLCKVKNSVFHYFYSTDAPRCVWYIETQ